MGSPGVAYGGLKDSALGISGFDAPPSPTYVAQSAPTEPYGGGFQPFIPTFGGKLDGNVHPSAGQAQGLPPMLSFAKRGFMGKRAALSVPQPSPPVILPQRASTIESVSPPATSPAAFGPRRRSSLGAPTRPLGPPVPPPMVQRPSLTEALAREQAFDGSFTASAKVFDITTKQEHAPKMPASLEALTLDVGRKTSVWATLLCVAFMHGKLVGERDVWGIMCEKAVEWVREALEGTDLQGRNVEVVMEEWKQAAGKFVR